METPAATLLAAAEVLDDARDAYTAAEARWSNHRTDAASAALTEARVAYKQAERAYRDAREKASR